MCNFSNGFKLCSCANETIKFREQEFYKKVGDELVKITNKKNGEIPLIHVWQLFRFKGENNTPETGRYMLPADNIGNGLDAEWIVLNLNDKNCFDFDYKPVEGDNLFIRENIKMGPYLSFIYTQEQWTIEHYSPFSYLTESFGEGKLTANDH